MARLGLETEIVDREVYQRTVERFREAEILLPTFAQLADPAAIPDKVRARLASVDPDAPHALNLFRVHWYNDRMRRGQSALPQHLVLPRELTGVDAEIIVALGAFFPMIAAHKVLAAYGCLAPRLVTGQFDPTQHKAIWPSTGNYCRGGVAISRIMRCRGVAVLPAGMSRERFSWLERWVSDPADIVRTPGSESNVKEIYDECARLDREPENIIFNQFCEFGNHLVHRTCTGRALEQLCETISTESSRDLTLRALVSATGSAGTLAAGDYLKQKLDAEIVAVEALECPTLLYNGFGEHNIQGIGDKHVPLIHNAMNTDFVVAVSERTSDSLDMLFSRPEGRAYLAKRHGLSDEQLEPLRWLGLSGLANVAAAIKYARYRRLGAGDAVVTVATDSAAMYDSERPQRCERHFGGEFSELHAAEVFGEHLRGLATDHLLELSQRDRERIFNLGYFTWVEQQGVSLEEFEQRRQPTFWQELSPLLERWDALIERFNEATGVGRS